MKQVGWEGRYNEKKVVTNQKSIIDATDAELIEACLKGDPAAWETLIRRYQSLIYSVPIRYRFSAPDAADIFQSVCLILLKKLKTLRDSNTLSSWLYITTKRECWKVAKRKSLEVELPDENSMTVEPAGEQLILQHQLKRGMEKLSEKCRDLLMALYYRNPPMSYEEVSEKFNIPFGSIGPTRARCLERLKKIITGQV